MINQIHSHAAGIDVGSQKIFVALLGEQPCCFDTFTAGFIAARDYLREHEVTTVAMEATGVYWIALYEILEAAGIEVCVVNGAHARNLPGRKSDVSDSQWLAELHAHGLLRPSFIAPENIRRLRSYQRLRDDHIQMASEHVQHMQKALAQMNVQLANVISDIVGVTGQKIVRAIIAGERDGGELAKLKNKHIRASKEEIEKSLRGNWREEHLFALKQAVALYDAYNDRLNECDRELEIMLGALQVHEVEAEQKKRRSNVKNAPKFDLRAHLIGMCGVDLTRIDGIEVMTALKVLSEVGADMSKFKSAKQFASWLGLCPGTKISGGKVLSGASKRTANRAAQALRMAAVSLKSSQSALGAYYRRLCGRLDKAKAITATAHKLARLIYTMLTKGTEYVDKGQDYYEERYRQRVLHHLTVRAQKLGFNLTPVPEAV